MSVDNYLQETGALATLAGILAGFAFSAVIQLLSIDKKDKISIATIVAFSASTVMFLYSLIVFVLLFASSAELNIVPLELDGLGTTALLVIIAAILVFLAGVGIGGWNHTRSTGIITSILAAITACLIVLSIITVLSVFPVQ